MISSDPGGRSVLWLPHCSSAHFPEEEPQVLVQFKPKSCLSPVFMFFPRFSKFWRRSSQQDLPGLRDNPSKCQDSLFRKSFWNTWPLATLPSLLLLTQKVCPSSSCSGLLLDPNHLPPPSAVFLNCLHTIGVPFCLCAHLESPIPASWLFFYSPPTH